MTTQDVWHHSLLVSEQNFERVSSCSRRNGFIFPSESIENLCQLGIFGIGDRLLVQLMDTKPPRDSWVNLQTISRQVRHAKKLGTPRWFEDHNIRSAVYRIVSLCLSLDYPQKIFLVE